MIEQYYLHNNQQQTSFTISDAPSTDTSQGKTDANAVQNQNVTSKETTDKSGNDDTQVNSQLTLMSLPKVPPSIITF